MTCADLRLDEYLDGELDGAARAAVEAHLSSCAACAGELQRSRKLEAVLRSVPSGAAPDADRFMQSVRLRARRPLPPPWMLAAAALLLAAGLVIVLSAGRKVDVAQELSRYAEKPSADIENRILSAGPAGLAVLEQALDQGDVRTQFAAASLLFKLADGPTRDRVLARYQQKKEPSTGWTLSEPGTDDEDSELVPIAVSLAVNGQDSRAIAVLQKLHRLNLAAQRKIVDAVVTLLHSTNVDVQRHALEIVKKLDIEFPLPALIELLDSPELGDEAYRFLKRETRKDFGRDKDAWRKAIGG
ncbi:MAG: zf-HC2 domain-containing protein [Planctomycetaceae bacterium]|nr:zf-HC2 domain-containing protein [Planctomycetaceae bacterium]